MSEIKITHCPPGAALGADDLRHWASRRLAGRSGMPMSKTEWEETEAKRAREDTAGYWLMREECRLKAEQKNGGNNGTKRSRHAPGHHTPGSTRR